MYEGETLLDAVHNAGMLNDTDRNALLAKAHGLYRRLMNAGNGRITHRAAGLACSLVNDEHNLRKAVSMMTAPGADRETKRKCRKIAEGIEARLPATCDKAAALLADAES